MNQASDRPQDGNRRFSSRLQDFSRMARRRYRGLTVLLLLLVLTAAGCRTLLTTGSYLIYGTNEPADWDGLKEKRVAVVCQVSNTMSYSETGQVGRPLARKIGSLLSQNGSEITVIDYRKVEKWLDEEGGDWEDLSQLGKDLDADIVLRVEIPEFKVRDGSQTLYRGKANVRIEAIDCRNGGKVLYDKTPSEIVYPPDMPVEYSSPKAFTLDFINVVADRIGRHFYPYDKYADYALDAQAGLRR